MSPAGSITGISLSLAIACVSFLLSRIHPALDALVVSIIFGMLLSNLLARREILAKGIDAMLRFALPLGIALYGTQLTFSNGIGHAAWFSVLVVFVISFTTTFSVARMLKLSGRLSLLLASGFSICGASAIAVISPLIRAEREDTSISIIAIMVMGLSAIVSYPILSDLLGLTAREFAFFSGTTVPMLGQVKVVTADAGKEVVNLALRFKLIRISMLLFVAGGIMLFSGRERDARRAPWFMTVFIALALMVNFADAAGPLTSTMEPLSKFFLSSALAAIGLSVDFDSITVEGARPLFAVFLSWLAVLLIIWAGLRFLHV